MTLQHNQRVILVSLVLLLFVAYWTPSKASQPQQGMSQHRVTAELSGIVTDENGPVPGAVVRIQTTTFATTTDAEGRFRLVARVDDEGPFPLTACATGYYCAGVQNSRIRWTSMSGCWTHIPDRREVPGFSRCTWAATWMAGKVP